MLHIKNIIFDIGAVLKNWNLDLTGIFGKEKGTAVKNAIWDSGLWYQLDHGLVEEEEILRQMIAVRPDLEQEIRWLWEHLDLISVRYDYAIPWLSQFKKQGYHIYYLSNYSRHFRLAVPETLDFLPLMEGGIFSCDVKIMKPDPAIYELLLEKYHLKAEECLFLDDNQANVDGAKLVGMEAIRFDGYKVSGPEIWKFLDEGGKENFENPNTGDEAGRSRKLNLPDDKSQKEKTGRLPRKVLACGDSNTYGWDPRDFFGTPYDHPWPSLLAEYTGGEVINCGEPGREIPVTDRQIHWLKRDIERYAPLDLLIVMLGTNDLLNSPHPTAGEAAVKMDTFLQSLLPMKCPDQEKSGSQACKILLLVPPKIKIDADRWLHASKYLAVEYKILADKYDIFYADASALDLPLAYDGIHLTEEGHRMLAEWLFQQIKRMASDKNPGM